MKTLVTKFVSDRMLYLYIVAGGLSACVDIAGFLTLNRFLDIHYLVTATLSFIAATWVNYILCQLLVFRYPTKYKNDTQLILTYFVSTVGLLIHHSILWLGVEYFILPLILAKLMAMSLAFIWNYLSRKYWVFQSSYDKPRPIP